MVQTIPVLGHEHIVVLYPTDHTAFCQELAQRLFTASIELGLKVSLRSCGELERTVAEQSRSATILVIDPLRCTAESGNGSTLATSLSRARKRILISVDAADSDRYRQQFQTPIHFEAVFDLGFADQQDKHPFPDIPYQFVFNGPTREETRIVDVRSKDRPIPWTLIGSETPDNLLLLAELINKLDPGGFVFLPKSAIASEDKVSLSGLAMKSILSKSDYYIWGSHGPTAHYESHRFIEALRAGAVPCKITSNHAAEDFDVPNVFSSVESFAETWKSPLPMYHAAKRFFLSKGDLAEHLKEALLRA